jgi:hypothetical protein
MPVFGTESERVGTWRDGDGDGEAGNVEVRGSRLFRGSCSLATVSRV